MVRLKHLAFQVLTSPWFDRFILVTIVLNCVTLSLYDPTRDYLDQSAFIINGDIFFTTIYIAELCIKLFVLGPSGYFKDTWNWVDFVVVSESILGFILDACSVEASLGGLSALRALRVLRPLKAASFVPEIKLLFETFTASLPVFLTILVCIGMVMVLFGNLGYTYWAGLLAHTCVNATSGALLDVRHDLVCSMHASVGYQCPAGFECVRHGAGPDGGATSYDNIWIASLQVFKALSLEGWQAAAWHTSDAVGAWAWVFYLVVILAGNVLLVLMFPAANSLKLRMAIDKEEARVKAEAERKAAEASAYADPVSPPRVAKTGVLRGGGRHRNGGTAGNAGGGGGGRAHASQLEALLFEYALMEGQELKAIKEEEARRRGGGGAPPSPPPPPPPRLTPFARSRAWARARAAVADDVGPVAKVVYAAIAANALLLCAPYAGMPRGAAAAVAALNVLLTAVFAVEAALKVAVLGPVGYFSDRYNLFDFIITMLGIVEVAVGAAGFVKAFRVVRVFRIPRIIRATGMRGGDDDARRKLRPQQEMGLARILELLTTASVWAVYVYTVLVLGMFMFSVLGMQFFGGRARLSFDPYNNSLLFSYDSFMRAFITILNLLTGNFWAQTMQSTMRDVGSIAAAYYVMWVVVARWVVVAIVVSILFFRVDKDVEENLRASARASMRGVHGLDQAFRRTCRRMLYLRWRAKSRELSGVSSERGCLTLLRYAPPKAPPTLLQRVRDNRRALLLLAPRSGLRLTLSFITAAPGQFLYDDARHRPPIESRGPLTWLLCRKRLRTTVHSAYEAAMAGVVVLGAASAALGLEIRTGAKDGATWQPVVDAMESVIVTVFCGELLVRSLAQGLVLLPGALLRSPMGVLDCTVTLVSVVGAFVGGLSAVLVLRLLRLVRVVRVASKSRGLRHILGAFTRSQKALLISVAIVLFFWYLWSVIGLQAWMDLFGVCSSPDMARQTGARKFYVYAPAIANRAECAAAGFDWLVPGMNFDNIFRALWSVFAVFSFDGWHPILFSAASAGAAAGDNAAPWGSVGAAFYFLVVVLSFMVLVHLFAAVLYSTFMYLSYTSARARLLSLRQAFWTMYRSKLEHVEPYSEPRKPERNRARIFLYDLLAARSFERAFAAFIFYNLVVRFLYACSYPSYEQAPLWVQMQEIVCAVIYVAEWLLRVYAYGGVLAISKTAFQRLDIATTAVMALVLFTSVTRAAQGAAAMRARAGGWRKLLNALSVVRVARLGAYARTIPELVYVIARSLELILPLVALLALATFFWGTLGMVFFGNDRFQNLLGGGRPHEPVNRYTGFLSLATAMQTMFGCATSPGSGGWWAVQSAYTDAAGSAAASAGVILFFSSYTLLCRYLLWNVFMMVLMFKFKIHSSDKAGVAMEQVNEFRRVWKRHAFKHTGSYGSIRAWQLTELLWELPAPLGAKGKPCYYDAQVLAKKVLVAMGWRAARAIDTRILAVVLARPQTHAGGSSGGGAASSRFNPLARLATLSRGGRGGGALPRLTPASAAAAAALNTLPCFSDDDDGAAADDADEEDDEDSVGGGGAGPAAAALRRRATVVGGGRGLGGWMIRRQSSVIAAPRPPMGQRLVLFNEALVAVHKLQVFAASITDEHDVAERRECAQRNLALLKLGVRRYIQHRNAARRQRGDPLTTSNKLAALLAAVEAEASLVRRARPAVFAERAATVLLAEFARWRERIDVEGLDAAVHAQGRCLIGSIRFELEIAELQEKTRAEVAHKHLGEGDRGVENLLVVARAYRASLATLLQRALRQQGDLVEPTWDAAALRTHQTLSIEPAAPPAPAAKGRAPKAEGVTALCADATAEWVFACTAAGTLRVFKARGRRARRDADDGGGGGGGGGGISGGGSVGVGEGVAYAQTQVLDVKQEGGVRGLCVACTPDAKRVFVGCTDKTVRQYVQDVKGWKESKKHAQRAKASGSGHSGSGGPKQSMQYQADAVATGHNGEVTCLEWVPELGLCLSGGADGTVRLWRPRSPRCVQSMDVCRRMLGSSTVHCLKVWRVKLPDALLAACVEASAPHAAAAVDAPLVALAGDDRGCVSVLPLRADSKFLALDAWAPMLRHAAHARGAVTAVQVAWGRVYTASGASGTIKIWQPKWQDERCLVMQSLELVGEQSVHSKPVTAIAAPPGLLLTASEDMSIVTWRAAAAASAQLPPPPPSPASAGGTARAPPPVPAATTQLSAVTHATDQGFIGHAAGVTALVAVANVALSADAAGGLVVRRAAAWSEAAVLREVPGAAEVARLLPMAKEVVREHRARGVHTAVEAAEGPNAAALRFIARAHARREAAANNSASVNNMMIGRSASDALYGGGAPGRRVSALGLPMPTRQSGEETRPALHTVSRPWTRDAQLLQHVTDHPAAYMAVAMHHYYPVQDLDAGPAEAPPGSGNVRAAAAAAAAPAAGAPPLPSAVPPTPTANAVTSAIHLQDQPPHSAMPAIPEGSNHALSCGSAHSSGAAAAAAAPTAMSTASVASDARRGTGAVGTPLSRSTRSRGTAAQRSRSGARITRVGSDISDLSDALSSSTPGGGGGGGAAAALARGGLALSSSNSGSDSDGYEACEEETRALGANPFLQPDAAADAPLSPSAVIGGLGPRRRSSARIVSAAPAAQAEHITTANQSLQGAGVTAAAAAVPPAAAAPSLFERFVAVMLPTEQPAQQQQRPDLTAAQSDGDSATISPSSRGEAPDPFAARDHSDAIAPQGVVLADTSSSESESEDGDGEQRSVRSGSSSAGDEGDVQPASKSESDVESGSESESESDSDGPSLRDAASTEFRLNTFAALARPSGAASSPTAAASAPTGVMIHDSSSEDESDESSGSEYDDDDPGVDAEEV